MNSKNIKPFLGRIKEEKISRILHWSFGCFVLIMLGVGIYMTTTEYSPSLYQWHKSLGVIFGLLIGIRLYWSIRHPWQSSSLQNKYESFFRHTTHILLLILLFAMPVSGLMSSGFSGFGIQVFDIVIISENINQVGEIEPYHAGIYQISKLSHKILAYFFIGLIVIHIAAVLKHHFIDKDGTLIKMLNGKYK